VNAKQDPDEASYGGASKRGLNHEPISGSWKPVTVFSLNVTLAAGQDVNLGLLLGGLAAGNAGQFS
jgi:hypothetical protein